MDWSWEEITGDDKRIEDRVPNSPTFPILEAGPVFIKACMRVGMTLVPTGAKNRSIAIVGSQSRLPQYKSTGPQYRLIGNPGEQSMLRKCS